MNIIIEMSFMYTKNNKGLRTDPMETPAFKSSQSVLEFRVMMFNAIFNNTSVISLLLVLLLGKTGLHVENHRHIGNH
jgi:hypothetical protein